MGQRMRPPFSSASERVREHVEDYGSPLSRPSGAKRLMMHIADALHVPPAEFYKPPAAVALGRETDSAVLEQECEALLGAYRRIRDPGKRQRLIALVQDVAERG